MLETLGSGGGTSLLSDSIQIARTPTYENSLAFFFWFCFFVRDISAGNRTSIDYDCREKHAKAQGPTGLRVPPPHPFLPAGEGRKKRDVPTDDDGSSSETTRKKLWK